MDRAAFREGMAEFRREMAAIRRRIANPPDFRSMGPEEIRAHFAERSQRLAEKIERLDRDFRKLEAERRRARDG